VANSRAREVIIMLESKVPVRRTKPCRGRIGWV
jgi:hypothetical protein